MADGYNYRKMYYELEEWYEKTINELEKYEYATIWQRIKFLFTGKI